MSVIFARAPLRISLGGGGTDLPSYYRQRGGFLIAGAIDKYIYMLTHTVFQKRFRLKYSEFEEVDHPSEIRHPIFRETLLRHWEGSPLEIASVADIPAGTGLGSSGSFTVCLLKALALGGRMASTPGGIAEAACHIEIDVLGEPSGKQDQYVAAHGGICAYTFNPDDSVTVEPLRISAETIAAMSDGFLLFFTGETRKATDILVRPGHAHATAGRGDGGQSRPHQGDRAPEPRPAGIGRPDDLRGPHARALGQQARADRRG